MAPRERESVVTFARSHRVPTSAFTFGVLLLVLGAALAVVERLALHRAREPEGEPVGSAKSRAFVLVRAARRMRIGFLILLLGAAVVAGESIEPRADPLAYMGAWICAALISVALVRLAALDYFASRRHWGGELRRSATDIERAQAELRKHLGPDAEALD